MDIFFFKSELFAKEKKLTKIKQQNQKKIKKIKKKGKKVA